MKPTSTQICRLLPHAVADGPANMARDEAMLDLVTKGPEAAAFRTYGWTEPTLSLGYFQYVGEAESDPRWRNVPLVRRPTGGGAIWHDQEITYALAVPGAHPLSRRSGELYLAVHEAIADLLSGFGLDTRRRGRGTGAGQLRRPFLCFTDQDPEDIVVGSMKIVGSAQRRRAGAILQHGSVLLTASSQTPELAGAADLASVPEDLLVWSNLLRQRLPEALGFRARDEDWAGEMIDRARELEISVYRDPSWTRRR